jgi:hypothetical protein
LQLKKVSVCVFAAACRGVFSLSLVFLLFLAFLLLLASLLVGPAIVGVLAVVGDSVVVGFPAFASLLVLPSLPLLCLCCGWLPCYCFPAYLYVTSALLLFLLQLYLMLLPCSFLFRVSDPH